MIETKYRIVSIPSNDYLFCIMSLKYLNSSVKILVRIGLFCYLWYDSVLDTKLDLAGGKTLSHFHFIRQKTDNDRL